MIKLRSAFKALWVTAYKPTQQDFADLFDSCILDEDYRGKWFSEIVGDTDQRITFATALPNGTTFDLIPVCLSNGSPVQFTISNIDLTGFNIIAADTAELLYQINIR